jgi:hypothetical protein
MEGLITIAILAAAGAVVWVSLSWVLGPLDCAAKVRRLPLQFGLADLLCLFVLVQLPIGFVHWITHITALQSLELAGDIVASIVAVALWWNGWRMLSRAGIHTVWQRGVILAVVVPGVIIGPVSLIALPFVALVVKCNWLLFALIPIVAILYAIGRFTRAVVASAQEESESQGKNAATN